MSQTISSFLLSDPGLVIVATLLISVLYASYNNYCQTTLPWINEKETLEFGYNAARLRFVSDAHALLKSGLQKWPAFNIMSDSGFRTVLSSQYAAEIRSHPSLSFDHALEDDFHAHIHGFEPFMLQNGIILNAVKTKLTQRLGSLTKPLSEETTSALQRNWTDNLHWHTVHARTTILQIVAQLSSKAFLGDQICRDPDWLRIMIDYTVDSFQAATELHQWPGFSRPLVAWILPSCRKQDLLHSGRTTQQYSDSLEWFEECAKGQKYDSAVCQLSLSLAAIHTTSDLLTQTILDLCGREELIKALREEILTVVQQEGWQKTTLYKLKLMDSVLKETQRLKPINSLSMRRIATSDVTLADGTTLPKGTSLSVSCERHWDGSVYPNPDTYDPYRFFRMRQLPGKEASSQFVAPSPDHMGFGFGKHACPGRFFAANEVKIALCHILLKYDFTVADGYTPRFLSIGSSINADPFARLEIRRRKEEIVL